MGNQKPRNTGGGRYRLFLIPVLLLLILLSACGRQAGGRGEQSTGPEQSGPAIQTVAPETDAAPADSGRTEQEESGTVSAGVDYGAYYTTAEEVAEYLYTYEELPPNFITKREARDLGWDSALGNLWEVADGMSIGGDRFGNREGLLPEAQGRVWYECDVNYAGGYRGGERVVWSNDWLIYYTQDHYQSFTQLY